MSAGLPDPPDLDFVLRVGRLLLPLSLYHRHTVTGLERLPRTGAWLMVTNHSLATYDGFLYGREVIRHLQRVPRGLGDKRIFQTPWVCDFARRIGLVEASPTAGRALLDAGQIVGVAPGGMREALRSSQDRYTVQWERRKGFVRLALRAGVPIVLAACPAADDLYEVYGNRLTDWVYEQLHVPVPFARGVGPSLWPRPVRLTHHIAPPIIPPRHDPRHEAEQTEALHATALATMQDLMSRR
ncbi:MAG: lysophospholipid acyltransferase family protein [Myxococcota bacterium]|nr:lysophospholipid acyltransferase family protein [Myxococcota bacterium]